MTTPSTNPPPALTAPATAVGPKLDGFIDKAQLAAHLQVTVRTVENWMRRGALPFIAVGKVRLFHWPDVVEHLRTHHRVCRSERTRATRR